MDLHAVIARHRRIALQFSGGRDSIAVLMLMKPFWHLLTVYWCNTGAAYPETLAYMELVKKMVPRFVEIAGDQPGVVREYGAPSDIVPASNTDIGLKVSGQPGLMMQDRYLCCARTMMEPTRLRMEQDGITLVIRGQRNADQLKSPVRSGEVHDGVELLFPIEDWSTKEVESYIRECGMPLPRFYNVMPSMPDCMTCTAWWEHGAALYLARHYPDTHAAVQARLQVIKAAVNEHIMHFNREIGHGH